MAAVKDRVKLDPAAILRWAVEHQARTRRWPSSKDSRPRSGMRGLSWRQIDTALRHGYYGLTGGSSLYRLICRARGIRPITIFMAPRGTLHVSHVRNWARHYRRVHGIWPSAHAGRIDGQKGLTWNAVNVALAQGYRGLPGGSSLARELALLAGDEAGLKAPRLTPRQILDWAREYRRRNGTWPNVTSGAVALGLSYTWDDVQSCLSHGARGWPGGDSLARFLRRHCNADVRLRHTGALSVRKILQWADAHHRTTGKWPNVKTGRVQDSAEGETWAGIEAALAGGSRGLPGGTTLANLLARNRGVRNIQDLPALKLPTIVRWARAHLRRTGTRPTHLSGEIRGSGGETWNGVASALYEGGRGLRDKNGRPLRLTLYQFLMSHGLDG